jgi:hypothetical protein
MEPDAPKVDIFRDTWVRYIGYANEVGESFRPLFPRLVAPTYIAAFGYVLGDANSKYDAAGEVSDHPTIADIALPPAISFCAKLAETRGYSADRKQEMQFHACVDTFLWQTLVRTTHSHSLLVSPGLYRNLHAEHGHGVCCAVWNRLAS